MPYYKTTITIYSEFDPTYMDLEDLGWEAMNGLAISTEQRAELVEPASLPEDAISFFDIMDVVDGIVDDEEDLPLD